MLTLEEKLAKRKRGECIFVGVAWIVITILALQFYRVYITYESFTIEQFNDLINKIAYNLENDFLFKLNKDCLKVVILTSVGCFIWLLMKLDKNKKYMKGVEHGSARFANKKEKREFEDKDDNNNVILSQNVKMSLDGRKIKRNCNTLVIGGSGTGKTMFHVLPNLLQANASYVLTDPKGELFEMTGKFFKELGYKIKVINLKDMNKSMCYNPFTYARGEQDIFKLIKNLIKNTNDGKNGGEAFWELAETALDNAICMYIREELKKEEQILPNVLKLLRAMKVSEEDESYKSPLDVIFEDLEKEKGESSMAVRQWKIFKSAAGKTSKSILISAMSRLAFLDIKECKELFSRDELEIEKIGQEKTILYLIVSDTDTTYNFIASMLYSQIIDVLVNDADTNGLKYPVRLILDEFSNVPPIPSFDKALATIRSRGISANIILQSIAQIKGEAYKDTWEAIVDNCDSTIFLGGKSSCKYIEEQLGKTTIDTLSKSRSLGHNKSNSFNEGIMGRELMTASELMEMNNKDSIVLIRGARAMYDPKYNIKNHKNSKYLGDAGKKGHPNNFSFEMLDRVKEMLDRDDSKVKRKTLDDILRHATVKEEEVKEMLDSLTNNLDLELDGMISELDDLMSE